MLSDLLHSGGVLQKWSHMPRDSETHADLPDLVWGHLDYDYSLKVPIQTPRCVITSEGTRKDLARLIIKPSWRWSHTLVCCFFFSSQSRWRLGNLSMKDVIYVRALDIALRCRWAAIGTKVLAKSLGAHSQPKWKDSPLIQVEGSFRIPQCEPHELPVRRKKWNVKVCILQIQSQHPHACLKISLKRSWHLHPDLLYEEADIQPLEVVDRMKLAHPFNARK